MRWRGYSTSQLFPLRKKFPSLPFDFASFRCEVLRVAQKKHGIAEEAAGRRRYSEAPAARIMRLMAAANSGRSVSMTLQMTSRSISR